MKGPRLACLAAPLAALCSVLATLAWTAVSGAESAGSFIETLPSESTGPVKFVLDTSLFYTDDLTPVVEICLEVPYDELAFRQEAGGYVSRVEVVVVFQDRAGRQVGGDDWRRDVWVERYDDTLDPESVYTAVASFTVPPGEYWLKVTCGAANSDLRGEVVKELIVRALPDTGLVLSDLRLGVCAAEGDSAAPTLLPNGSRSFGSESNRICAEAEAYALDGAEGDSLLAQLAVVDDEARVVWSANGVFPKQGRRSLLAFVVPTDSLSWGVYELTLEVNIGGYQARVARSFEMDETRIGVAMDLERLLDLMSLVATDEELETLAVLSGLERQAFVQQIWKKRDPDPGTPRNEFRVEFFKRLRYAKAHFAERDREGWQTDRGRVYIRNGPPDRMELRQGVPGSLSPNAKLEIWYYDATNTHYVFEDFGGTGEFTLVDVVQG